MDPETTSSEPAVEVVITDPAPAPEPTPEPEPPATETETAYRLGLSEAAEQELRDQLRRQEEQIGQLSAAVAGLQVRETEVEETVEEVVEEVMPDEKPSTPSGLRWWEKMFCGGGH